MLTVTCILCQGGRNSDDADRGKVSSSARPLHGTAGGSRMRGEQIPPTTTPPGDYNSMYSLTIMYTEAYSKYLI